MSLLVWPASRPSEAGSADAMALRLACISLPLLGEVFDAGTVSRLLIPKLIAGECQDLCACSPTHPQFHATV